jgi:predicted acetyltransferase
MAIQVRRMTEQDIQTAATVQAEAFNWDAASMIRRYHESPIYGWRDGWLVEADGEIAAVALAVATNWWFNGVSYPVSTIRAVGVHPTARRRGLASQLMRAIVQADQEAGRAFSLLFPFQHSFYRRLGYATAGFTHFYRIPAAQLPDDPALRLHVRSARESDREAIYDLHRQSLLIGAGGLERNTAQWAGRWARNNERWVVYDEDGAQGYLAYQQIEHQIDIRELVALTPAAERGLWSFVAAQSAQYSIATCHAPLDKPLWLMLREPLMFEAANRGFELNDAAALTAGMMARLVNVVGAFERCQFAAELTGQITLRLHDPVLEANTTTLELRFDGGRARATPTTAAPNLSCDIVTLSQLFCGVIRADAARWYGQLAGDDAAIALLGRAFSGTMPFIHPFDYF